MADIPTSRCQEIGESTSTFDLSQPSCKDSDNLSSRRSNAGPGIQDLEGIEPFSSEPLYSIFSTRQKQYIIFLTAWGGFFSGLSSSIYYPALNAIAKDLNVSNAVINLTLTSFMIFQGLAPTIFGDLGDMVGRRPAYILGFVIFIGANIGLALQNNYAALLVLRCLQSTGSSGTVALGNGVVSDVATSGERGKYIGYAQFGTMAGPPLAPIIGGMLSQFLGWRSLFWFLTISAGVYMVPFCISFPETGRNVVGNGSISPQGWNMSVLNYLQSRQEHNGSELSATTSVQEKKAAQAELARQRKLRWPNPMRTLHIIAEKDVSIILVYNSLVLAAFYDITASLPSLFAEIYGFNNLQIGLCFIPFGIGCTIASIASGYLMDFNYKRCAQAAGIQIDLQRNTNLQNFPLEKARIQIIYPLLYLGILATIAYGWALETNAPLAAPLVLQFIIGCSFLASFSIMSTLLVDLYPYSPATATAANNLVRCLTGAAGTAAIIPMIEGMGRGWCFTFIAAVVFATSPLLWVEVRWGPGWREERRVRVERRKMREGVELQGEVRRGGDGDEEKK